jgi:uncharacterized protein DUF5060
VNEPLHHPSHPRALGALLALATASGLLGAQITVDAGPDRLLLPPAQSVRLQGTLRGYKASTVPTQTTFSWAQISGPVAVILDGDTLSPTIVPSHAGSLRFSLKVNDLLTGPHSDDVLVHAFGDDQDAEVAGVSRKWNKLALTFTHDVALSETGTPNPFLDLRLVTYFFHAESATLRVVPGFFAADGNAAETSATSGTRWRVNFTPDRAGTWYYVASFRSGPGLALDADTEAGEAVSFDGANGFFFVEPADPSAPGFLAKGRLDYVAGHHLRFAETHEHFLKGGAGGPENFLGYYEFDGTSDLGGPFNDLDTTGTFDGLHHYDPHLADYVDLGVPLWKNGKGRRLFGALSYLSAHGVNSLYTLTYNIDGGDGQEVWVWTSPLEKLRFDVSKLAQWERMLDHMSRAGIVWQAVTQEIENDHALDGGALGTQRRLYYRELVARFAHAPGLVWNLGEENTNTPEERKAFADYIRNIDPYDHPIALHNVVGTLPETFGPLLGTHLELVSLQGDPTNTPARARQLVLDSAAAGRPWVVNFDEQTPANEGVVPDAVDFWHDLVRRESLWPMLLGQGGGCDWYFGYGFPNSDLDCEDFRSRDNLWALTLRARELVQSTVPFHEMHHADALATGNGPSVLAKPGECYLAYLPFGGECTLDLEGNGGTYLVRWFDARNGGALVNGAVTQLVGPGVRSLGTPPGSGDWCAVVRRAGDLAPEVESVDVEPGRFRAGDDFAIRVHAVDPNGPGDLLSGSATVRDASGNLVSTLPLTPRGGSLLSFFLPNAPGGAPGTWSVDVTVEDSTGLSAQGSTTFLMN